MLINDMIEGKNIHFSPVDRKPLCSFSTKLCKLRRLNGYAFCVRHILEDSSAPFKRCDFVVKSTSQPCSAAIPCSEERVYCHSHMQVLGLLPKKERRSKKINDDGLGDSISSPGHELALSNADDKAQFDDIINVITENHADCGTNQTFRCSTSSFPDITAPVIREASHTVTVCSPLVCKTQSKMRQSSSCYLEKCGGAVLATSTRPRGIAGRDASVLIPGVNDIQRLQAASRTRTTTRQRKSRSDFSLLPAHCAKNQLTGRRGKSDVVGEPIRGDSKADHTSVKYNQNMPCQSLYTRLANARSHDVDIDSSFYGCINPAIFGSDAQLYDSEEDISSLRLEEMDQWRSRAISATKARLEVQLHSFEASRCQRTRAAANVACYARLLLACAKRSRLDTAAAVMTPLGSHTKSAARQHASLSKLLRPLLDKVGRQNPCMGFRPCLYGNSVEGGGKQIVAYDSICSQAALPYTNHCLRHSVQNGNQHLFGSAPAAFAANGGDAESMMESLQPAIARSSLSSAAPDVPAHYHDSAVATVTVKAQHCDIKVAVSHVDQMAVMRRTFKKVKKLQSPPVSTAKKKNFHEASILSASSCHIGVANGVAVATAEASRRTSPDTLQNLFSPHLEQEYSCAVVTSGSLSPADKVFELPLDHADSSRLLDDSEIQQVLSKLPAGTFDLFNGKSECEMDFGAAGVGLEDKDLTNESILEDGDGRLELPKNIADTILESEERMGQHEMDTGYELSHLESSFVESDFRAMTQVLVQPGISSSDCMHNGSSNSCSKLPRSSAALGSIGSGITPAMSCVPAAQGSCNFLTSTRGSDSVSGHCVLPSSEQYTAAKLPYVPLLNHHASIRLLPQQQQMQAALPLGFSMMEAAQSGLQQYHTLPPPVQCGSYWDSTLVPASHFAVPNGYNDCGGKYSMLSQSPCEHPVGSMMQTDLRSCTKVTNSCGDAYQPASMYYSHLPMQQQQQHSMLPHR